VIRDRNEKVRLCSRDDVEVNAARRFDVGRHRIALIRIGDDFYAIGDRCTHADYSLSEGEVYPDEKEIECWKHGSTFSLIDGQPQSLPAVKPVPVYPVEVEDGDVWVVLPK
jgi:3-phenylpropionate/trans-cinnamate dioxygenase ferredoxin subunit